MDAIQLSLFANRLNGVCEEMGALLRRSAFSPNIKDRLDFSCAIFDSHGGLCAQAAHIPVHLGSMAFAMADVVNQVDWLSDQLVVLNDPYLGGTHLPDVTVIAPVFKESLAPVAFIATRAHHANIGAHSPGSMPISSHLEQEGVIIEPTWLMKAAPDNSGITHWNLELAARLLAQPGLNEVPLHSPRFADFVAQAGACQLGVKRLLELLDGSSETDFQQGIATLNDYAQQLALASLAKIPAGLYQFTDYMDDDGQGQSDLVIHASVEVNEGTIHVDFDGTSDQVPGNINAPLSVAAAGVYYVFRCLMPDHAPACAGLFSPISLSAPTGSLVNACYPAAVAAGNVETSSRVVDVILGALSKALPSQIPAASQGTMNNLAMGEVGDKGWDYYETSGGGMGASAKRSGLSAVQTHMTNTLNTPIESLEAHYPLRVRQYAVRRGSGGRGEYHGGDGLVRELELLAPAHFTLLTERRNLAPWGLCGGGDGLPGQNSLNGKDLLPKCSGDLKAGDRLMIKTPGGGGYGSLQRTEP